MASLSWNNINKNIIVTYTKKRFYSRFLYKLTYHVPGIRLVTYGDPTALKDRINNYNQRGKPSSMTYWLDTKSNNETADYEQLVDFMLMYQKKSEGLKFRVESCIFNIYTRTEQEIYDIANGPLKKWASALQIVTIVESPTALNLLEKGYTLVKKEPDYAYRVRIREGFHRQEHKPLAQYLKNLGTEIKTSKFLISSLEDGAKYFRGGHVYVNDLRLVDMLKLISPDSIGFVDHMVIQ